MDAWNFSAPVYQNFEEEEGCTNTRTAVKKRESEEKYESSQIGKMEKMQVDETRPERATYEVPNRTPQRGTFKVSSKTPERGTFQVPNKTPQRGTFQVPNKTPQSKQSNTPTQPVRQSPRLAAIAKSIRSSNASRGLVSTNFGGKNHRRSLSEGSAIVTHFTKVKKHAVQRKVAIVRPEIAETVASASSLTNEDLVNLEATAQIRRTFTSNRQRTDCASKGPLKAVPLKNTRPVEFNFATDTRSRTKTEEESADDTLVEFQKTLRSGTSMITDQPKGSTKVKPFNLHNSTKPKELPQPFHSLAELNLQFQTKTPQRFRTKPLNNNMPILEGNKRSHAHIGVTQPKTPRLATRSRTRTVEHLTREEIEAMELEDAQKNQFKARPVNKKILVEPDIKLHVTSKVYTVPEPFDITDTRKESMRVSSKLGSSAGNISTSSSSSASHGEATSIWEKRRTEVKPFSFDTRDVEMIRKKEEKIQKVIEGDRKLTEFHAQPMPVLDTVKGLPKKKPATPTKVQPFAMHSDVRGSVRQEQLQAELEELERLEKEHREFKAQPDTVLHRGPFVPKPSTKPLTDISGFSLNTDKRAEERHAFDMHLKEKEQQIEDEKRMMEERKRKEEEEQIKELRKNTVHKAQSVRHFKPLDIKIGLLPPTIPVTPKFTVDERLRTRTRSKTQTPNTTLDSTIMTTNHTTTFNFTNITTTADTTSANDMGATFTM